MNHMKLVLCGGAPIWANSCKEKKTQNGISCEYRCTKCGQTGHTVVKGQ